MVPYKPRSTSAKRARRVSGTNDMPLMPPPEPQPPPRIIEPMEKPDANMTLKYTFGVNAWRQWVSSVAFNSARTVRLNENTYDRKNLLGYREKCRVGETKYANEKDKIVQDRSLATYRGRIELFPVSFRKGGEKAERLRICSRYDILSLFR